jgi:hypothetical protein
MLLKTLLNEDFPPLPFSFHDIRPRCAYLFRAIPVIWMPAAKMAFAFGAVLWGAGFYNGGGKKVRQNRDGSGIPARI